MVNFINVEWGLNGFVFSILELRFNNFGASALFGVNFSRHFLYFDFLFINVKVFDLTD